MTISIEQLIDVSAGTVSEVGSGGYSTRNLPKTGTIHGISLVCTDASGDPVAHATILNEIKEITLRAGQEDVLTSEGMKPSEIVAISKFFNYQKNFDYTAGVLSIPLFPEGIVSPQNKKIYALGMFDTSGNRIDKLYLGVRMADTVSTIANIEVIVHREDRESTLYPLYKYDLYENNRSSSGIDTVENLPSAEPNKGLIGLFVEEASGVNVTSHKIKVDNRVIQDRSEALNTDRLKRNGLAPQVGMYPIVFANYNGSSDFLDLNINSIEGKFEFDAAPNNYRTIGAVLAFNA